MCRRLEPGDILRFTPSEYERFMELRIAPYFSFSECKRERIHKTFRLFGREIRCASIFKHPVVYMRYDGPEHNDWLKYNDWRKE